MVTTEGVAEMALRLVMVTVVLVVVGGDVGSGGDGDAGLGWCALIQHRCVCINS